MKRKISLYWPLAIVIPLAAAGCLQFDGTDASHAATSAPLAANQLTAELARTVSYGLVGTETATPAPTLHTATRG